MTDEYSVADATICSTGFYPDLFAHKSVSPGIEGSECACSSLLNSLCSSKQQASAATDDSSVSHSGSKCAITVSSFLDSVSKHSSSVKRVRRNLCEETYLREENSAARSLAQLKARLQAASTAGQSDVAIPRVVRANNKLEGVSLVGSRARGGNKTRNLRGHHYNRRAETDILLDNYRLRIARRSPAGERRSAVVMEGTRGRRRSGSAVRQYLAHGGVGGMSD